MKGILIDNRKAIIDYDSGGAIFQAWYLNDIIPGHVGDALMMYSHVGGDYPSTTLYIQSVKSFIEQTDWTEEMLDAIKNDGMKKRVQTFLAEMEE